MGNLDKLISVPWHTKRVFISGLTVKQIKGELGFQIYTAEYLRKRGEFGWMHSANENRGSGVQGVQAGVRAKRSGQCKGWPDWVCPHRRLAIELKLPNGEVSPEQVKWLEYFKGIGFTAEVVYSFDEFKKLVEQEFKGFWDYERGYN